MNASTIGSVKVHIVFAFAVPTLIVLTVLGITNADWLYANLPDWSVWLMFKLPVRMGLPLTIIAWAMYAKYQREKEAGLRSVEPFREPHIMMHLGYTVIPLLWEDGTRLDLNAYHETIHKDEDSAYASGTNERETVFWHAHKAMHQWMDENPDDVIGYRQAVNLQRLVDQIAEPDFTYWPLGSTDWSRRQ